MSMGVVWEELKGKVSTGVLVGELKGRVSMGVVGMSLAV